MRRRIGELEASNQSLGHQASELRVNLQDQAAQYESKVSDGELTSAWVIFKPAVQLAGKDQEILYLKQEIENIKRQYEEIYGTKLEDLAEVRVYSGLIVPEIQRMRRSVQR